MKVILTSDVASLGREGEVVEVAQGYAQNFLVPRKLAIPATPGNLKQLEFKRSSLEKREAEHRAHAEQLAERISAQPVTVAAKAGAEGKLYGSVTAKDVVHAAREQLGVEIEKKQIIIKEPIKSLGDHEVGVHVFPEITAALTVSVIACEEMPGQGVAEEAAAEVTEEVAEETAEGSEQPAAEQEESTETAAETASEEEPKS